MRLRESACKPHSGTPSVSINPTTPVPKQRKTEQNDGNTAPPEEPSTNGSTTAEPKKRVRSAKTGAKKNAAKKTAAKTGAKKTSSRPVPKKGASYEPSDDEIRLRAYFIAERRTQQSLAGDAAQDWLDARQQLIEEYDQTRS